VSATPVSNPENALAVIGMSGRWPGARNVTEFWQNVRAGRECISRFPAEELEVRGAAALAGRADYVRARSIVEGVDQFDAAFFGVLPKEAELMDPQHRVFLECCWEALEDAGYDPQAYDGAIGVFAGCSTNTYFLRNLCADRAFIEDYVGAYPLGNYPTMLGAITDSLSTRVSYKLNLRGPSLTLQTACSTSLVAVCQACQSLLTYQSDMALAGGVSITFPQKRGYHFEEGGMGSADGRCRPFDADARGTVFGSGAGVVLLKRLADALADGDHIQAVIKGFAVNNDGAEKVGYTAPSVEGQATVVAMAHAVADVHPESIGYLESHGTATPLGDPIEFAALLKAFRAQTEAKGFCALGGVKANVGHLEAAAGVTGLINAIQALAHGELPPQIGFKAPNADIDLANSPFFVNTSLSSWKQNGHPRRAGVSSFGVGGTNAHVVLEEPPATGTVPPDLPAQLLVLSARSAPALDQATRNLAEHLRACPNADLDSVSFTLQAGRRAFEHRRAIVCSGVKDAIHALENRDRSRVITSSQSGGAPSVVFMFPGQGSQYRKMGAELYRSVPTFRHDVDLCAEILTAHLQLDLRTAVYQADGRSTGEAWELVETALAQPALFVTEYALAKLWMRWGVQPQAMIGHSVGEFVAACLAGVFSLEDALAIIATRARMMQQLPAGAMLSVRLGENELTPLLNGELSLAAANGPRLSVVAGPVAAIGALEQKLNQQGIAARRLATSHAFHSQMMDPIIGPFTEYVGRFRLNEPRIPYVCGVSGAWATAAEATDPSYWARHFREPVRFSNGLQLLRGLDQSLFLEVGPGRVLCTLARQQREGDSGPIAVACLPDAAGAGTDVQAMLSAAGALWVRGVPLNWREMHGQGVRRCPLPTYPFERKRYWIDPPAPTPESTGPVANLGPASAESPPSSSQSETIMPEPKSAPEQASRVGRIRAALIGIFQDLSGLSLGECDPSATFLEMGFDSLFLTQVTQALQGKFGLRITFRQLLDRESTLDALAAYLDAKLPPEILAPEPASTATTPATTPMTPVLESTSLPAGQSVIESIVREQLQAMSQLMAKQLEALRGAGLAPAAPAASPLAAVLPPAAPSQHSDDAPPTKATEFKPFGPYKPVQRGQVGGLTERQARHLDDLVRRYTARTARSKELTQRRRQVLADPRVAAGFRSQWKELVYPIVTLRSLGSRLWDIDGNEYIDLLNGFGPILFGHSPSFVTEAVAAQLKEGFEIGPQTPLAGEVAELVRELTGNERATFCNTGSEAVMAAMRLARTVTARQKIVLFAGDYHGTFDEVLVKGIRKGGAPHSLPIAPGIPAEKVANVIVLDYGTAESLEYIRQHARELAAVLVEPVQSRHPALQPVDFLRQVRKITEESETALIFDEIVTGFRTHPGGAQALFGIRADLATYGKVAGGGMPIGILAGRAQFMDALDGGMWQYGDESYPETGVTFFAGTFVRHPIALAAARAVLQHLKEAGPELQKSLNDRTTTLVQALNGCFESRRVPSRIEHFASWFYFNFPSDQPYASLLYYHLREKGIHIQEGFPCFLTTAHSEADLDAVVRAFNESIAELQDGGFLLSPDQPLTVGVPAAAPGILSSGLVLPKEVPLTESQSEVWLAARLSEEASCAFNESFTLQMRENLNYSALHKALQTVIDRHDALRSTFDPRRDCVRVLDAMPLDMPIVDLCSQAGADRSAAIEGIIRSDASQPFNLVAGPLVRVQLIKLERDLHTLLFTTHHIVCDGWSTNVLLSELGQLYGALCAAAPAALPATMPFRDYALAQARWKQTPERAEVEAWWAQKFAKPANPLELPTDRPRSSMKSFKGDTARRLISADTYQRLKRFGARHGCTLFATLLAGFKTLLHRLTGQTDIVVGIPAAGQSLVEAESLVGHCVNFLPVRGSFEGDPSVTALLAQVRGALLDGYDHQNYTYGSLVQKLGLRRDPSRLPLVEVQFNLERVGANLNFPGLEVQVDPCPKSFVNFDLFLNAVESESGLVLDCDYNRDLFDRATIERWLGQYETLLEGLMADPGQAISALPLLNEAERHLLLVEWNDTRAVYPQDRCLHHLIGEQSARTPGSVAVICENRQLSYAQLDESANRLANFLQKRGVGTGDRVAICLDRSLEMLIGVLGILKAGAAYVPLDPDFPRERITAVVDDAKLSLILTQPSLASRLELTGEQVVRLDAVWSQVARESNQPPASTVTASDLAYVIYTSGSTGKPKGVQVSHRSLVNLLWSMARRPGLDAHDTLLAVTTLAFDIAALELYLPLCVGGRVVLATRETASDGHKLLASLAASGATVMQATPATWRLLIEAGWNGPAHLKVLCGGEALPRDLADQLLARSKSVWNMYGPTETTVWSAASPVQPGPEPVTIGPPIANTEFYVLDDKGQAVPIGLPGELHIGGDGVARGYWNRPELTAEKFIPDPFRGDPGYRLYKTGDLVRYRPDGTLEFLGRLDTQVKVRGFRIETSEVEHFLKQCPGIKDCVVVAREDAPGDKRLVAYFVATPPAPASSDLRQLLSARLPAYMVPSVFVRLDALPLTPNGKVDRRALPPPEGAGMERKAATVPPRNPRERTLAEICASVLKVKEVGIHDSLFDLGADSIQVFQITARANDAGLDLTPTQILSARTIAAICDQLDGLSLAPPGAEVPQLVAVSRERYRMQRKQLATREPVDGQGPP
jgi:amino acid adenylation domain-containing protein